MTSSLVVKQVNKPFRPIYNLHLSTIRARLQSLQDPIYNLQNRTLETRSNTDRFYTASSNPAVDFPEGLAAASIRSPALHKRNQHTRMQSTRTHSCTRTTPASPKKKHDEQKHEVIKLTSKCGSARDSRRGCRGIR